MQNSNHVPLLSNLECTKNSNSDLDRCFPSLQLLDKMAVLGILEKKENTNQNHYLKHHVDLISILENWQQVSLHHKLNSVFATWYFSSISNIPGAVSSKKAQIWGIFGFFNPYNKNRTYKLQIQIHCLLTENL